MAFENYQRNNALGEVTCVAYRNFSVDRYPLVIVLGDTKFAKLVVLSKIPMESKQQSARALQWLHWAKENFIDVKVTIKSGCTLIEYIIRK
jgi:hypothetical protein